MTASASVGVVRGRDADTPSRRTTRGSSGLAYHALQLRAEQRYVLRQGSEVPQVCGLRIYRRMHKWAEGLGQRLLLRLL